MTLADGRSWDFAGGNKGGSVICERLATAMTLLPRPHLADRRVELIEGRVPTSGPWFASLDQTNNTIRCVIRSAPSHIQLGIVLTFLGVQIGLDALGRGGIFFHGALAEWSGIGVILSAPSGTGKTTASNRLPVPWCSLSDDTTLVVRDAQGVYWAHPWPTSSRFSSGDTCASWDVQRAVPLRGIFFLSQSDDDKVKPVASAKAAILLLESSDQPEYLMIKEQNEGEPRALRLQRFDNACSLARVIPAYILNLSLTGDFWYKIEQVLDETLDRSRVRGSYRPVKEP